jgi:hypothetical protein
MITQIALIGLYLIALPIVSVVLVDSIERLAIAARETWAELREMDGEL